MASRGGRREGAGAPRGHRKSTLEKIERANIEEQIRQAIVAHDRAKATGKKMAIDVLDDLMNTFLGGAAHYQPNLANPTAKPLADEGKFLAYAERAMDCAARLAKYQSPTFKGIMYQAPVTPQQPLPNTSDDDNVVYINDPVAALRAYRNCLLVSQGKKAV